MLNFIELIRTRHSVRDYNPDPVPDELLSQILEAGRLAPTGANKQPQRLIVVREKSGLDKIKKAANAYNAPLVIIICADHDKVWKRPYDGKMITDIDASIVTDHMMLMATELGLGTVWICYFKPDVIKSEFNLPDNTEPVNILAIGYENEELGNTRPRTSRKPLEAIVFYESF